MRVNEFVFGRRRNLGNYEHEECTLNVTVDEHDNLDEVIEFTKVKVAETLGLQPRPEQIVEVKEDGNVETKSGSTVHAGTGEKVSKKQTKKKAAKKATRAKSAKKTEDTPVEENVTYALDQIKQYLGNVWKAKGKAVAVDILKDFGVAKSDELRVEDYPQVVEQCQKALA